MRKYVTGIGIVGALGYIWFQAGIFDAFIRFVTIGLVPGTNISFSAPVMLGLMILILWVSLVPLSDYLLRSKTRL